MKLGRWRRGSADSSCRSGGQGKRRDQEPLLNGSLSEVGGSLVPSEPVST